MVKGLQGFAVGVGNFILFQVLVTMQGSPATGVVTLKISELKVGLRVSVPTDRLTDVYPWQERYGSILEIEEFFGAYRVLVHLDGESSRVIGIDPEDVDYE